MARKKLSDNKADLNMTPMIDVTFQLIIFFMLSVQSASDELDTRIALSRPEASQARKDDAVLKAGNRAIVNAVSVDSDPKYARQDVPEYLQGQVDYYMIRMPVRKVGDHPQRKVRRDQANDLVAMLVDRRLAAKDAGKPDNEFTIVVRADKRTRWSEVEPVIVAALEAKVPKMNITALTQRGGE